MQEDGQTSYKETPLALSSPPGLLPLVLGLEFEEGFWSRKKILLLQSLAKWKHQTGLL